MGMSIILISAILVLITFLLIMNVVLKNLLPFFRERKYIKLEIERSEKEEEYFYWKRELRNLYLRSIPFAEWFIGR